MRAAIVTGGSRGLGAALCELYAERGWHILEFSRSAPHPYSVQLDLADPRSSQSGLDEAFRELAAEPVEEIVVVNNAAVLEPVGSVAHALLGEIQAHLNVNLLSALLLARSFFSAFQEHDCAKTYANISSGAAVKGHAGWSLYCATKAATESFVRAVALEQAAHPHPIRAININPGVMDTAMQATVRSASEADFPELERFVRLKRDGLLADPEIIATRIAELVASRPAAGGTYSVGG